MLGMNYPNAVVDHRINTKWTKLQALAAFGTGILVEHGIPGILSQALGHCLNLSHPFADGFGTYIR